VVECDSMGENFITCQKCGSTSPIVSSVEIYQDAGELTDTESGEMLPDVSCRLDCPKCGVVVQTIKPPTRDKKQN